MHERGFSHDWEGGEGKPTTRPPLPFPLELLPQNPRERSTTTQKAQNTYFQDSGLKPRISGIKNSAELAGGNQSINQPRPPGGVVHVPWKGSRQPCRSASRPRQHQLSTAGADLEGLCLWFDDELFRTQAADTGPDHWFDLSARQKRRWLDNFRRNQFEWRGVLEGPFKQYLEKEGMLQNYFTYTKPKQKEHFEKWKFGPGKMQKPAAKTSKKDPQRGLVPKAMARPASVPKESSPCDEDGAKTPVPAAVDWELESDHDLQRSRRKVRGLSSISSSEL